MKQKSLSRFLIILGLSVPYLVMLSVITGIMVAPQSTPLSDWLLTYYRKVWLFVGWMGVLPYSVGLIIWSLSPYERDHFGRWLSINLIFATLAFSVFPLVGPLLTLFYGLLILYRATWLRRVYRNA